MIILSKSLKRTATVLVTSCLLSAPGWAAEAPAKLRAMVDTAIHPLMAEHGVPGMAVGITIDGQAYVFNYGVASKESRAPVDAATLFELGSISKTLTATLATYAQGLGKLSLDEHPSTYMAQLKGSAIDKASLLHLGTFTAGGLPLQFPDSVTDATMADYFQHWKPDAAPGVQRRYSNASLGLFGHLAALALKADFADAMERQLFPQLGLKNTYFQMPASEMGRYAWGYNKESKPVRMNPGVLARQNYGLTSTAADMIRFVQANIDPAGLPKPMQRALAGTHVGYFKSGAMVQGLGWEQYPYPVTLDDLLSGNAYDMIMDPNPALRLERPHAAATPTLFNKTGSTDGFGNYIVFVPQKKIGIVLLSNRNYPIPARVKAAHAILVQLALMAK